MINSKYYAVAISAICVFLASCGSEPKSRSPHDITDKTDKDTRAKEEKAKAEKRR